MNITLNIHLTTQTRQTLKSHIMFVLYEAARYGDPSRLTLNVHWMWLSRFQCSRSSSRL